MKTIFKILFFVAIFQAAYSGILGSRGRHFSGGVEDFLLKKLGSRCIPGLLDEGCSNGGLPGIGPDEDFLNGGGSPGKRCINLWDEGCSNGGLPGIGTDEDFLNGGGGPGKRCINLWDEGCSNGGLPGIGPDEDFLNGGGSPGKRCINLWDEGCSNGGLPGIGPDEEFLNGGGSPGKRNAQRIPLYEIKKQLAIQYARHHG